MDLTIILSIVLPFLIGWLLKSPVGKYIPEPVAQVLARLDPAAVQTIMLHVGTREARRESAIDYVQTALREYGIELDRKSAAQVVDYLTTAYKAGHSFVRDKVK